MIFVVAVRTNDYISVYETSLTEGHKTIGIVADISAIPEFKLRALQAGNRLQREATGLRESLSRVPTGRSARRLFPRPDALASQWRADV